MGYEEREIWQRVFGQFPVPQDRSELAVLARESRALAAIYRQLMEGASGKTRERLRRLHEGERANLACLQGMAALTGAEIGRQPPLSVPKEPMAKALTKCCHRTRRALVEYTARSADPEFGALFRQMASREEVQLARAVQLLGSVH